MKPRARRVTIAAAVLGAGVSAVLVVLNWGMVRDHVEAWHFQLTRETETIHFPVADVLVIREREPEPTRCRYRVLEQRFPRSACVVIPDGEAPHTFYWPPGGPCR